MSEQEGNSAWLDNFVKTLWELPTSTLLVLYIHGEHNGQTYWTPWDAKAARDAVIAEIDRRLPVIRCVGCGSKPHRDPMPLHGGFCHGDDR